MARTKPGKVNNDPARPVHTPSTPNNLNMANAPMGSMIVDEGYESNDDTDQALPSAADASVPTVRREQAEFLATPPNVEAPISQASLGDTVRISSANPGDKPHSSWEKIDVHTAKCDKCSKHNTSVIQRCRDCNQQWCRNCIGSVGNDNRHIVNIDKMDWTPKSSEDKDKAKSSGRPATKKKSGARGPRGAAQSRVGKNTSSKKSRISQHPQDRIYRDIETLRDVTPASMASFRTRLPSPWVGDDATDDGTVDDFSDRAPSGSHRPYHQPHEFQPTSMRVPINQSSAYAVRETSYWRPSPPSFERDQGARGFRDHYEHPRDEMAAYASSSVNPALQQAAANQWSETPAGREFAQALARTEAQDSQNVRRELDMMRENGWKFSPVLVRLRQQGKYLEAEERCNLAMNLVMTQRGITGHAFESLSENEHED